MYKVNLTYFKPTGKYYSSGSYESNGKEIFDIWNEVRDMRKRGKLPDLVEGASNFIISIDVPSHSFNHPHLITL